MNRGSKSLGQIEGETEIDKLGKRVWKDAESVFPKQPILEVIYWRMNSTMKWPSTQGPTPLPNDKDQRTDDTSCHFVPLS